MNKEVLRRRKNRVGRAFFFYLGVVLFFCVFFKSLLPVIAFLVALAVGSSWPGSESRRRRCLAGGGTTTRTLPLCRVFALLLWGGGVCRRQWWWL